jgi:hypothetical protein
MATAEETYAMVGKEPLWAMAACCLEAAGFAWDAGQREFRDRDGAPILILVSGERAGRGSEVLHPDPGDPGVGELIVSHGLDGGVAGGLHKVVRKTYRRLVKNARGEA